MEKKFEFAKQLILEAGLFIKNKMMEKIEIQMKDRFDDLVTNIDKDVQELIINHIKKDYPSDFILAEENNVRHKWNKGNVWVIDPIDGTVNFIAQKTDFVVMIAYFEEGIGRFGLIYDVINDVLFSGGGEFSVYRNQERLSPYQPKELHQMLVISNAKMFAENDHGIADLVSHSLGCRNYGSAGFSMSRVLNGQAWAYFSYIYPWDYAAASIMGEKLGYQLLTLSGEKPNFETRQKMMFFPKVDKKVIEQYIKET
ncbi:inositol monophosphatase family protein [Streptococcus zalophi]|uniref:Inositol monophosphatase family protein n=1 Tax=Streptococcus zalophi TaxID=640031 RepID=A0A934P9Q3_9STRE|nr:inositol monophosphatase family protein [Streptococcus zalophi]MBJ8349521.1 inositol monophosphatase family protein [Streptococcus zalophi]MCR8967284.1 inositol monophosphatase family protein [Streptococcus zalophi]